VSPPRCCGLADPLIAYWKSSGAVRLEAPLFLWCHQRLLRAFIQSDELMPQAFFTIRALDYRYGN
jgi:hypothetical protein